MLPQPPTSSLFPYTTLFRSLTLFSTARFIYGTLQLNRALADAVALSATEHAHLIDRLSKTAATPATLPPIIDRKSTRLNSSHVEISYAVFCLKKKNEHRRAA